MRVMVFEVRYVYNCISNVANNAYGGCVDL